MEAEKTKGLMPYNEELESKVMATLMACTVEQIREAREQLTPSCFYTPRLNRLYNLMCQVNERGEQWDICSAATEALKTCPNILDAPYIAEVAQGKVFFTVAEMYMQNGIPYLRQLAQKRNLWLLAKELEASSLNASTDADEAVNKLRDKLTAITNEGRETDICTLSETLKDLGQTVWANKSGANRNKSTHTGFPYLDAKGGFQNSDLVVIAGATSMGKTSFANSVVLNAIKQGKKIAFFSLEMTNEQLTARLLSAEIGIASNKIANGILTEDEYKAFGQGWRNYSAFADNLFFSYKAGTSIENIITATRKLKHRHGIDGIVIDYLQLIGGKERGTTQEQFIAQCARRLKNLAVELDIWVVLLSQLNRDKDNPIPTMNRLRDSGQIAEAADMVLMVYRPQYYNEQEGKNLKYPNPHGSTETRGTALIMLEKGRNVGVGSFVCGFEAKTTHFYPLATIPHATASQQNSVDLPIF